MPRPRTIVLLVADSLRYDSMMQGGDPGLPWTQEHAVRFTQARAGGCWTLPSHASMFTGLMPHQHGATEQTRGIRKDVPTLAEGLGELGYSTHQVTANVVTTHIFGLDRGFDEVVRIWKHVPTEHRKIHEVLVLAGKPRLRRRIFSKDFVVGKMSEDLEASKVWLQRTWPAVFDRARGIVQESGRTGRPAFVFLNLMESHFPYHIGPVFGTTQTGILGQWAEIRGLYHLVNQTWLREDREFIPPEMLAVLRERQRRAWREMAPAIDEFVREMAEDPDTLVVVCSDHGDNFGEQGWLYHFSNVTDAGNRVPLFYLRPGDRTPRAVDTPVSTRDLYGTILADAGRPGAGAHLCDTPERSLPILQSFWYDAQGRTLPRYRYNQICFLENGMRWLLRHGAWHAAPPQADGEEPTFEPLPADVRPLEEIPLPGERRRTYRTVLAEYERFTATLAA